MKGMALDRTKVVLRRLPPAISQATLMDQVDGVFSGRYHWVSFCPGKTSQRNQTFSRAYIDFKRPEDVLEFADFFNGHVFVNEKGAQFKTIVEYAPSQRIPKHLSNKDGREGTISTDPEYLEFLEFLAKPVENLPSAEIQMEKREAERAGAVKESPIVTPLMDFVRQKRAVKTGSERAYSHGRSSRRNGGSAGRSPGSSSKRGSRKRMVSTMYVLRDTVRNTSGEDNPTYILVGKHDDQQLSDKIIALTRRNGSDSLENDAGVAYGGKKKVLLLKGKEKEIFHENGAPSVKNACSSPASRPNSQREGGSKTINRILLNKDVLHSLSRDWSGQPMEASNLENKRLPHPIHAQLVPEDTNGSADGKVVRNESHGFPGEKRESGGLKLDSAEGNHGDAVADLPNSSNGGAKTLAVGRSNSYVLVNGPYKKMGHRGQARNVKDSDGLFTNEGKHGKRRSASGYGSREKQVWVQKSSCGS